MNITDKLLDTYFKGRCTPEEKLAINTFLTQINEFPDHLLKKEEWDNVGEAHLSQENSDQLFNKIKSKAFEKFKLKRWYKNVAAAAVIFMVIGLGYYTLTTHNSETKLVLNEKKQNETKRVVDWKSTVNYANSPERIILPDGSEIKVYPGSEIRYAQPFVKDKREVYLTGKGYFHVKKDKKHPFVVYANGVATTALGTSFTITAIKNSSHVKVELHSGKVLVENMASDKQTPIFNNMLKPGDILNINKLNGTLILSNRMKMQSINFAQIPLSEVFRTLEKHYEKEISFNQADIDGKSFTGTVHFQESLDTILAEITDLNKLKIVKSGKGYQIKK